MDEIRLLCPSGSIGTGFRLSSLEEGLRAEPHAIAADAGSNDVGASYLGSGKPMYPRSTYRRDLYHVLVAAQQRGIPLIIGSAGGGGTNAGVDLFTEFLSEIAAEEGLRFKLARIYSEQSAECVLAKLRAGRVDPLWPSGPLEPQTVTRAARIVGMMGAEPIMAALDDGADVVVAGRSSDASLFAALPLLKGYPAGLAWHAGKVLECGAAAAEHRLVPDCMFGVVRRDHFVIWPPDPRLRCTTGSVAAHTLYENGDPYLLREPSGQLITRECVFEQEGERAVRISGSAFDDSLPYTIKLEAAEMAGFHTVAVAGIRDPYIVREIDAFFGHVREQTQAKLAEEKGLRPEDYLLHFHLYGYNAVMGPMEPETRPAHEVGVVFEAFGRTQEEANDVCIAGRYVALHHFVRNWTGQVTNLALPHSPPEMPRGPAYRFTMHHTVEPDDPHEMFRTELASV